MKLILDIDGREAYPVRALPLITGWDFTALDVPESLAGDLDEYRAFEQVRAHMGQVSPQTFGPERWVRYTQIIEDIEDRQLDRPEFEAQAIRALPPGVFVWRDEWERAYLSWPEAGQPPNPDAPVAHELAATVFEGFELDATPRVAAANAPSPSSAPSPAPIPDPTPTVPTGQGCTLKRSALIEKLEPTWPSIVADLAESSRNGLDRAKASGKRGHWDEARALEWCRERGKLKSQATGPSLLGSKVHRVT